MKKSVRDHKEPNRLFYCPKEKARGLEAAAYGRQRRRELDRQGKKKPPNLATS